MVTELQTDSHHSTLYYYHLRFFATEFFFVKVNITLVHNSIKIQFLDLLIFAFLDDVILVELDYYLGSLCFSLRNSISLSHSIKSSSLPPFIILKNKNNYFHINTLPSYWLNELTNKRDPC